MTEKETQKQERTSWLGFIMRFVIAALVLMLTAFFTPGYAIANFWTALLQSAVIVGLDYILQVATGIDASPFGRGITGFLVSAIIIYITQFVVPGVRVTMIGAVIAALVIGIVEAIFPVRIMR